MSSVIPRISQRVEIAGVKQQLQIELKGTEARSIDEEMRMKIHSLDEEKGQKLRMEKVGTN